VRPSGVEPPLLSEHGPEPCASANSATGAFRAGREISRASGDVNRPRRSWARLNPGLDYIPDPTPDRGRPRPAVVAQFECNRLIALALVIEVSLGLVDCVLRCRSPCAPRTYPLDAGFPITFYLGSNDPVAPVNFL
jgi:hypothetical protein